MEFRTTYERIRVNSVPGDPVAIVFGLEVDETGRTDLVVKGKENLYEEIQSHADSVDINKILERFSNGDPDALNRYQGYYGDFTDVPTSFADMLNKVIKAEDLFNTLPLDVREKFDFNLGQFIAALGERPTQEVISPPSVEKPDLKEKMEVDVSE